MNNLVRGDGSLTRLEALVRDLTVVLESFLQLVHEILALEWLIAPDLRKVLLRRLVEKDLSEGLIPLENSGVRLQTEIEDDLLHPKSSGGIEADEVLTEVEDRFRAADAPLRLREARETEVEEELGALDQWVVGADLVRRAEDGLFGLRAELLEGFLGVGRAKIAEYVDVHEGEVYVVFQPLEELLEKLPSFDKDDDFEGEEFDAEDVSQDQVDLLERDFRSHNLIEDAVPEELPFLVSHSAVLLEDLPPFQGAPAYQDLPR